jgi:hypothetical protein
MKTLVIIALGTLYLTGCSTQPPIDNPGRRLIYGVIEHPAHPIHARPPRPEPNAEEIRRIEAPVTINGSALRWHRNGADRPYRLEQQIAPGQWIEVPAFHSDEEHANRLDLRWSDQNGTLVQEQFTNGHWVKVAHPFGNPP